MESKNSGKLLDIWKKMLCSIQRDKSKEHEKKRFEKYIKDIATNQKCTKQEEETPKRVFVVVTHYMGGSAAEQVFSSDKAAQTYIINRNDEGGSPTVQEFSVQGIMKDKGYVFTAGSYDPSNDIHNLIGIYGNFDDAYKAAGEQGEVLQKEIHNN